MNKNNATTNASLAGGLGLALLGTTCCALPIILVTAGMGSVVASVVSTLPWLASLSQYKGITFSITALVLAYSWWRLSRSGQSGQCVVEEGRRLKWQRRVLGISTVIFIAAVLAAYALLPITLWFES
jgi:mercuric ion transport protein